MDFLFVVIATLLGVGIGSFLNVVILRGETGETLGGRSRCDSCKETLSARELIPIISFLLQKGQCCRCGTALFLQYPLVEALTGTCFAISAWFILESFGFTPHALFYAILSFTGISAAIVATVSDFRTNILPNGTTLILVFVGIIATITRYYLLQEGSAFFFDFGTALVIAFFLGGLWFVSRGTWIGLGDAKLIFATSLIVGFPTSIVAFLFSFWLGAGIATLLWLLGKKSLQDRMPFGPYIILGSVLAFFLADWFLRATGLWLLF